MATIKKYDFVEIEYTATIKENGAMFDTTKTLLVICVGENQILKGIEEQMIGKEFGKEYILEVSSANAFGRKNPKLIQLIPTNKFRQQNIQPIPGLQLNIDGVFGIVKTVSGGRCLVDFNHPLASKDLVYNIKINKIVDDNKEKLNSLLKTYLHIKDAEIELKVESASIKSKHNIPKQAQEEFIKIANKIIPGIKKVDFTIQEEKNK